MTIDLEAIEREHDCDVDGKPCFVCALLARVRELEQRDLETITQMQEASIREFKEGLRELSGHHAHLGSYKTCIVCRTCDRLLTPNPTRNRPPTAPPSERRER